MYIPPDRLEKLKDEFDLYNHLLSRGFVFKPKDSVKNPTRLDGYEYRIMKLSYGKGTSLTLTLARLSSGRYVYANLHDDSDKGSCLDFFMNHENQSFQEALETLSSGNPLGGMVQSNPAKTKVDAKPETPFLSIISVAPFRYDKYFEERGILKTILKHGFIRGSMSKVHYSLKDQPEKVFYTHGFKLKDAEGEVRSYNLRGSMHPDGLFSGPREQSIWYAAGERIGTFIIGESAIDCISYYEKHSDELVDPILISSEGRFSKHYATTVKALLGEGLAEFDGILINDNDIFGYFYDLSWMRNLFDLPLTVSINKEKSTGRNMIRVKSEDLKYQMLLDLEDEGQLELYTLQTCHELVMKLAGSLGVRLHKSKRNDWNEDLQNG